jgi:hypothetical protein
MPAGFLEFFLVIIFAGCCLPYLLTAPAGDTNSNT